MCGNVLNDVGESIANLVGAGPRGGPLGSVKSTVAPIVAASLNLVPGVGNVLSAADFANLAGQNFASGNVLGGALDLVGAGTGGYGAYNSGELSNVSNALGLGSGSGSAAAGAGAAAPAAGASGAAISAPGGIASAVPTDITTLAGTGPSDVSMLAGTGPSEVSTLAGVPTVAAPSASPGILGSIENAGSSAIGSIENAGSAAGNWVSNLFGGAGSGVETPAQFGTVGAPAAGASTITALQAPEDFGTGISAAAAPSSSVLGTLGNAVSKNPLGATLAGGGLLYNLLTGNKSNNTLNELKGEAQGLEAQGNTLSNYLNSGTLPPTVQTALNDASNAAKAQVKSYYASLGLTGSSQEQSALQQVDMNAVNSTATIGEQLLTQGISESQIASDLLEGVIGANQQQAQSTGTAVANLAAALSGTRPGINIGGMVIS